MDAPGVRRVGRGAPGGARCATAREILKESHRLPEGEKGIVLGEARWLGGKPFDK